MKQTTKQLLLGVTIVIIYTIFGLRVKDRLKNTDEVQPTPILKSKSLDKSASASFELLLDYPNLFSAPRHQAQNPSKLERGPIKNISAEKKKVDTKVVFPKIKGIVKADYKTATVYVELDGTNQRRSIGDTVGTGLKLVDIKKSSIQLISLPTFAPVDTLLYVSHGNFE